MIGRHEARRQVRRLEELAASTSSTLDSRQKLFERARVEEAARGAHGERELAEDRQRAHVRRGPPAGRRRQRLDGAESPVPRDSVEHFATDEVDVVAKRLVRSRRRHVAVVREGGGDGGVEVPLAAEVIEQRYGSTAPRARKREELVHVRIHEPRLFRRQGREKRIDLLGLEPRRVLADGLDVLDAAQRRKRRRVAVHHDLRP
mmetsp:Transcript_11763/g.35283  ORF Transcript_11763/g.35283 Transcript_11763/m.35283 type:complete len:203 (+) Transcript_11763:649-1257(+)